MVYDAPLRKHLTTLVVHHSALDYDYGPRDIQVLHMVLKGWADIGYHFVIDGFGQLYEGRSLSIRGTHTGGANTGTVGVCLLGHYDLSTPLREQMKILSLLALTLMNDYSVRYLAGHRDFQPGVTECPGNNLEAFIDDLARALGMKLGTEGYIPPAV